MRREGEVVPRYNIFAEMATRVQINKEQYLAQNPEDAKAFKEMLEEANKKTKKEDNEESIPDLHAIQLTKAFMLFVQRIGPLVDCWDSMYSLFTIKDTRNTVTFMLVATYMIVYQE